MEKKANLTKRICIFLIIFQISIDNLKQWLAKYKCNFWRLRDMKRISQKLTFWQQRFRGARARRIVSDYLWFWSKVSCLRNKPLAKRDLYMWRPARYQLIHQWLEQKQKRGVRQKREQLGHVKEEAKCEKSKIRASTINFKLVHSNWHTCILTHTRACRSYFHRKQFKSFSLMVMSCQPQYCFSRSLIFDKIDKLVTYVVINVSSQL